MTEITLGNAVAKTLAAFVFSGSGALMIHLANRESWSSAAEKLGGYFTGFLLLSLGVVEVLDLVGVLERGGPWR